jgi:hypothetical protein
MNTRIVSITLAACLMAAGSVTALADNDDSQDANKAVAQLYELQRPSTPQPAVPASMQRQRPIILMICWRCLRTMRF